MCLRNKLWISRQCPFVFIGYSLTINSPWVYRIYPMVAEALPAIKKDIS
jgi:hypothetical protein